MARLKQLGARLILAIMAVPRLIFTARTVFLAALALICTGVSFFSLPCALIVGGALLIVDIRT